MVNGFDLWLLGNPGNNNRDLSALVTMGMMVFNILVTKVIVIISMLL